MAPESDAMSRRGESLNARDVARDFVAAASLFAHTFIEDISPDDSALDPGELQRRRRRVCAAVGAAIVATFETSALTDQERARIFSDCEGGNVRGLEKALRRQSRFPRGNPESGEIFSSQS